MYQTFQEMSQRSTLAYVLSKVRLRCCYEKAGRQFAWFIHISQDKAKMLITFSPATSRFLKYFNILRSLSQCGQFFILVTMIRGGGHCVLPPPFDFAFH